MSGSNFTADHSAYVKATGGRHNAPGVIDLRTWTSMSEISREGFMLLALAHAADLISPQPVAVVVSDTAGTW